MLRHRQLFSILLISVAAASPLAAQTSSPAAPTHLQSDTTDQQSDDEGVRLGFQSGVSAGTVHYKEGRSEQALGAVLRWAPVRWFSLSATPTGVRVHEPPLTVGAPQSTHSGLVDLPVEAMVTHKLGVGVAFDPTLAAGFGITLPVGDTARGFGAGKTGYSGTVGLGFTPVQSMWLHFGAGRSLTEVATLSAFSAGSGWGDASAGVSITDRFSVSGGYSTDLGATDATYGRSTSVEGGVEIAVYGAETFHLNASHGLSGVAPNWSFAMGFGSAFPYLDHLGAGSSIDQLRKTFGGGTHGLGSGGSNGRGHGRP